MLADLHVPGFAGLRAFFHTHKVFTDIDSNGIANHALPSAKQATHHGE